MFGIANSSRICHQCTNAICAAELLELPEVLKTPTDAIYAAAGDPEHRCQDQEERKKGGMASTTGRVQATPVMTKFVTLVVCRQAALRHTTSSS